MHISVFASKSLRVLILKHLIPKERDEYKHQANIIIPSISIIRV